MIIYVISFFEALSSGLTGINLALYLKFVLGLSEIDAAKVLSTFAVISTILILTCGRLIDKFGIKRCAIVGASLLMLGRATLGLTSSIYITGVCLFFMCLGSAIKSGSVVVFLKKNNLSFKLDYFIFNIAFFFAGILFDFIKNYQVVYLCASGFTLLNVLALLKLPKDVIAPKPTSSAPIDWKAIKLVLGYNFIMVPITCIFTFMADFIPKSAIHEMGPNAPVGKLYGSLNPFIVLFTVPVFAYLSKRYKLNPYNTAIFGTLISATSLLVTLSPGTYFTLVVAAIVVFTVGEAIWSPSNMEVATLICPAGKEGAYLTLSLIPKTIGGIFMSYFLAFSFTHFIYVEHANFRIPFILMGIFSLATPVALILRKKTMSYAIKELNIA